MVVMDIYLYISIQSFVSQLCTVFEICELKLKKKKKKKNNNNNNNKEKMKNSENANFNNFPAVQFWSYFDEPHILTIGIYPFVKTDSRLNAYCHGNVDFPNVWQ